jgi:hypothetical protein
LVCCSVFFWKQEGNIVCHEGKDQEGYTFHPVA